MAHLQKERRAGSQQRHNQSSSHSAVKWDPSFLLSARDHGDANGKKLPHGHSIAANAGQRTPPLALGSHRSRQDSTSIELPYIPVAAVCNFNALAVHQAWADCCWEQRIQSAAQVYII